MNSVKECVFCRIKGLLEEIPQKSGNNTIPCKRGIYEDDYCIATLAPEQYTKGHTLLILKNHRVDIADTNISREELSGFIDALNKLAIHLKGKLQDYENNVPQRIYIAILCDGIEHLHAHLIPRYPFTDADGNIYEKLFLERDGRKNINRKIEKDELGGFWYIAEREKNYKKSEFWNKSDEERAKYLEEFAGKLRMSLI
ncbi:HIT domain protein [uncultured archaeon]|nr:HIT domain protein [uncultured archaeon]